MQRKRIPYRATKPAIIVHCEGDTIMDQGPMGVGVVTTAPTPNPFEVLNRV